MDVGLIVSILAAVAAAELLALVRPSALLPSGPTDIALTAVAVGVLVGRLTALAFDDPTSLFALRDIAALRGGVEFWPGVAAGLLVLMVGAARHGISIGSRLATLAPFGLAAAAGYQATCFVREGCFGPHLTLGIAPDGLLLPVEVAGAVVLAALAVTLTGLPRDCSPFLVVGLAVWGLAVERAVASFWLPVVSDGLSRPHRQSIAVAIAGGLGLIGWALRARAHRPEDPRLVGP